MLLEKYCFTVDVNEHYVDKGSLIRQLVVSGAISKPPSDDLTAHQQQNELT